MEESVMNILDDLTIKYSYQKSFYWLKFKKEQYLDFYLPDYNIAIECQGEQHFSPIDFSYNGKTEEAKRKLFIIQEREKNKYNLCKKHNIPLYYIIYNENIKEKLFSILIENKII